MNLPKIKIIVCKYFLQTQAKQSSGKSLPRKRSRSQSDQRPSKKQIKRK